MNLEYKSEFGSRNSELNPPLPQPTPTPPKRGIKGGVVGLILLLLLIFVSCTNPFNPKVFDAGSHRLMGLPNDRPDNVLRNLMQAYNQMNLDLYISTLDKDFYFFVTSADIPEIGVDWWGYDVEIEFHRNLFNRGSNSRLVPNAIFLDLTIPPSSDWWGDNQVGHENWLVIRCRFHLRLAFSTQNDMFATGFARFHMKPVGDRWYIGRWVDESD